MLLGDRHAQHRRAEPLLPDDDPRAAVQEVWKRDGATGAVAVRDAKLVGYMIGLIEDEHPIWGHHSWVERAGHACADGEILRDVYATAARLWMEAGADRHYVMVPAVGDRPDPWYRLGFAHMHVEAIRESGAEPMSFPDGVTVRRGGPDDLETAIRIDRLIFELQQQPPSFGLLRPHTPEERDADWAESLSDPGLAYFVVERDGEAVGHSTLYPPKPEFGVPSDAVYLASTAIVPEIRGSGVGVALTEHVLSWAREAGYSSVVTNWRMTNLLASRFWPSRGFRPVFHRLHRAVGMG